MVQRSKMFCHTGIPNHLVWLKFPVRTIRSIRNSRLTGRLPVRAQARSIGRRKAARIRSRLVQYSTEAGTIGDVGRRTAARVGGRNAANVGGGHAASVGGRTAAGW